MLGSACSRGSSRGRLSGHIADDQSSLPFPPPSLVLQTPPTPGPVFAITFLKKAGPPSPAASTYQERDA